MTDLRTSPVNDGELFSERARQYAHDKALLDRLQVLEAGCGWGRGLDYGDCGHQVTGVDVDLPGLREHTRRREDLHAWHLGDLRTVPMPPRAYDVVYAPYVIERIPHAELVLDRLVASLKPGGLLLVRLRDRDTAFGFLDRTLPASVRGLLGHGRPDGSAPDEQLPPATVYEKVASRQGIRWYCMMRGLVIAEEYATRHSVTSAGAGSGLLDALCRCVAGLTRGRLTAEHSEVAFVIRKPENRYARVI
ncbi:class I SAM-dependent methyltransferase [Actinomadura kijaniata]|uniref:class I SAM-dependent methyltransferase n=1 Tax=Actinomadura kijaniata TaxID=46161 RepID=UPI003F19F062